MKIFILSLLTSIVFATEYEDVIYLKNGSIIYGTIVELKVNDFCKIQSGKNLFIYKMNQIEKIKKEPLEIEKLSNLPDEDFDQDISIQKNTNFKPFGLRFGIDFSKDIMFQDRQYELLLYEEYEFDEDIERTLFLSFETLVKKSNLGFGFEYLLKGDLEYILSARPELGIMSVYAIVASPLSDKVYTFFKFGFNYIDFDLNNSFNDVVGYSYTIPGLPQTFWYITDMKLDVHGDYMYGFGFDMNATQISLTKHIGTSELKVWFGDEFGQSWSNMYSDTFEVTR